MTPGARIELLLDLGRAGLMPPDLAWQALWTPLDGGPTPPMPESFPARWEAACSVDDEPAPDSQP